MRVIKRMCILMTAVLLLGCVTACNRKKDDGKVDKKAVELKVWGAQEDQEMLQGMVEESA